MNIVLLLAHSIEEYDQVKLLSSLGYDVFSLGAYSDPAHPGDDARPPLPDVPDHPELREACDEYRRLMADLYGPAKDKVDWAKYVLPDAVFDWADVIICHHLEHTWLLPDWPRLREKRVIWRTVGQSVEHNERLMAPLRRQGLQIVRYSPKERNIPGYAGEDALIRFYKDPAEWYGWTGENAVVLNISQHSDKPHERDRWLNWPFFLEATAGLPTLIAGNNSETSGGIGRVGYDDMRALLRTSRCYLYTGTQPASYTLGLIEAMMTGIPVVSIGPEHMQIFPYGPKLFEGHELAGDWDDNPAVVRQHLEILLRTPLVGDEGRDWAIENFGRDKIAAQWRAFLGAPRTSS